MALTNREKWSLTVVFLISGVLIIVFALASEETRSLLYTMSALLILPLASVRVMLTAINFFKTKKMLLGVLWSIVSIMLALLFLVPLSQLRNILNQQ